MSDSNKSKLKGWVRVVAIIIPYIITLGLFQGLGLIVSGVGFSRTVEPNVFQNLVISFSGLVGSFLIIGIFRKNVDRKSFRSLGFQMQQFGKDVIWGLTIGASIILLGFGLLIALGEITVSNVHFNWGSFFAGFALFVVVALNEELLMRGYVLNNFMDSWNKYVALSVSSLIFALLHMANPNFSWIGMTNIFIAGYLLGLSYVFTRNLWFPLALHFSWNFFQGTILGFHVSGNEIWSVVELERSADTIWNGGSFGLEGSLLVLFLELICLVLIFLLFKNRTPEEAKIVSELSPEPVVSNEMIEP